MREHAAHYKQYITVHPGGGARRNPKRKNTNAYSSPANSLPPTPEEIQSAFESHLQQMARGGTYGDNMEINAFSAAFGVDVKLYQRDFAYMVSGRKDDVKREVAHIAYHVSSPTMAGKMRSGQYKLTTKPDMGTLFLNTKP